MKSPVKLQASYMQVRKGKVARTVEIGSGGVCFADFDSRGRLIGIETLSPIEVTIQGPAHIRVNANGVEYSHAQQT